jgi:hypothetical protein
MQSVNIKSGADDLFTLSPLECIATSAIHALKIWQKDYHNFLLQYWFLNYESGMLLGSKNLQHCMLDKIYGVSVEYRLSRIDELIDVFSSPKKFVILKCRASGLDFFPRGLLQFEGVGFYHHFLITGYEKHKRSFDCLDAIAGFRGDYLEEKIEKLAEPDGLLDYQILEINDDFTPPPGESLFLATAYSNYMAFLNNTELPLGKKAIQKFSEVLLKTDRHEDIKAWVYRNNLTLVSIITNRLAVWEAYQKTGLIKRDCISELSSKVTEIIKHWRAVNFLIVKCGVRPADRKTRIAITEHLAAVSAGEEDFLHRMIVAGQELGRRQP